MLGFDAMDPVLTRQLISAGRMPAFARLLEESAQRPTRNPPGLFVGSLWSTFFTGQTAIETGFHCWEEIVPGGYERRETTAASIRGTPFWETLSQAGRRVAVVDVPHSRAGTPLNGVQISEWGCHDRHFGLRTHPPELAEELVARYGIHPVLSVDPFVEGDWAPDDYVFREGRLRTIDEERQLLAGLLVGADAKRQMSVDLLADGPWDVFLSVFGETHSVGHQAWHLHDPAHPRFDRRAREAVGDPVVQVYEKMDEVLAAHLAAIDEDATLLVLLSHGMAAHYDGTHLLPEVLRRLDGVYGSLSLGRSRTGRSLSAAWDAMPARLRDASRRPLAALLRRHRGQRELKPLPEYETPEQRQTQAFFMSPNNYVVGGVRFNLVGREAAGRVQPGRELDELRARLEADLLALVNVETGTSVITRVERSDEHYQRDALDSLPDLFLHWNKDHLIETVWSPRFGMIGGEYTHWRSGDHRPEGLLLERSPGTTPDAELPPVAINQLGAVISAQLGVELESVPS
jgi:predicted AlkP superfamily phosphohydrolase/phosphomutase